MVSLELGKELGKKVRKFKLTQFLTTQNDLARETGGGY
jgi:hypothetical protein